MLTKLRANCVGSLAARVLLYNDPEAIAEITNTFPNSFYARTSDDELVFVTNRDLKSPITINLDSASNLDHVVKPLERISVQANTLLIGTDTYVDLVQATNYEPKNAPQSEINAQSGQIERALSDAALILGIIDTEQSVLDKRGLAHEAAAEFARNATISLRASGTEGQFREIAGSLIGLGSGFTPSGDDMLGGYLALYNSFAKDMGRPQILIESAMLQKRTSWISAKLLDYMQRLIVDEQISHMISSAAAGDRDQFVLALESLLPRGHTSGIDISVGAILALSLIQDITSRQKETELLMSKMGFTS